MDLRELRSLVVLAEQLHFGKASTLLHLSQPALTKQIRKIEDELGAPLFERGLGGTRLTALGAEWTPKAHDVLRRFDELLANGREHAEGKRGRLRIGFGVHSLEVIPQIVIALRSRAPLAEFTLQDMSTKEQFQALKDDGLDVGLLRMPVNLDRTYTHFPVVKDRLALVVPNHLQKAKAVSLKSCQHLPFVMISKDRSPGFFGHVLEACAGEGFHPRIVQEVREFPTAIALVRAGMGVTLIPASLWQSPLSGVSCHPLSKATAAWSVSAVWKRRSSNPLLKMFNEELTRYVSASKASE